MKKQTVLMLLMAFFSLCLTSCSSDDDDFDYPMDEVYGIWKATELKVGNDWYDVTKYPYTRFGMTISFYENGSFYGTGYFGTGSGTFNVKGKTITTYIDGEVYATYTIQELHSSTAWLTMSMDGESLEMRVEKE